MNWPEGIISLILHSGDVRCYTVHHSECRFFNGVFPSNETKLSHRWPAAAGKLWQAFLSHYPS